MHLFRIHNLPRIGQILFFLFAFHFSLSNDWEMVTILVCCIAGAEFSCFCIRYSIRKQQEAEREADNARAKAEEAHLELYKLEAKTKRFGKKS